LSFLKDSLGGFSALVVDPYINIAQLQELGCNGNYARNILLEESNLWQSARSGLPFKAADGVERIIYAAAPTVHKHMAASANADWQVPALWQGWRRWWCIIADDELVPVRTGWWEGIANVRSDEAERREQ